MDYEIIELANIEAEELCRKITVDLPEYFGLPECNESYAQGVKEKVNFAARKDNILVALLSLDFPYPNNANIYWMGIMKANQGIGIAKALLTRAETYALLKNAKTITVETLSPKESDENYLKTYEFYIKNGFNPLFDLKPPGYEWNMVYMAKILKASN